MTVRLERPTASSTPMRSRKRLGYVLGAAAAVAALIGIAVVVNRDDGSKNVVPATPSTTTTPITASTVPATVPVTAPPISVPTPAAVAAPAALVANTTLADDRVFQIKFDGLNLWATGEASTDLLRIDPATGQVAEALILPSPTTTDWLQAHAGLLYVTTDAGVVIVNGETKQISEPKAGGPGGIFGIAFTDDAAWLIRSTLNGSTGTNTLERWDFNLTSMTTSVDIGAFHTGGIVGSGTSFFLATEGQGLLRFDDSGTLVATIPDVGYSFVLGVAAGSVWVPDYDTGEVIRIDLATNEIVARTRVAGINAHSVFATDTSVWVTTYSAGNIQVIDPATNEMTAQIHATPQPLSVALVGGAVWIAGGGQLNSFVAAAG